MTKQNTLMPVRWGAVIAWMALIFFLSSQSSLPAVPGLWTELQDIIGHLVEYGILALLLNWALAGSGVRRPRAWAFALVVLYALSDEFHQSFVPGRNPDVFDILTDAIGAAGALYLSRYPRWRQLTWKTGR